MRYRSCWISDLHLGSKKAETDLIYSFLKKNEFDTLYLVGDIIDIWRWRQAGLLKAKDSQEHVNVVQRILKLAKKGTKVYYVVGNHDEFLFHFLKDDIRDFGNIRLSESLEHVTANGKKLLIMHGHQFDMITRRAPWLAKLGDRGYELSIWMNRAYNKLRRRFGMKYWSLSKFIKRNVKKAVMIIDRFEESVIRYAEDQDCDGIICGHIHHPEIKIIEGLVYYNSGCWTDRDNCNALVEREDGTIDLIQWDGEREVLLKSTNPDRQEESDQVLADNREVWVS